MTSSVNTRSICKDGGISNTRTSVVIARTDESKSIVGCTA